MKRRVFLKQSIMASAGLAVSPWVISGDSADSFISTEIEYGKSNYTDIKVLVLEGTPRKRGQIHGESLRKGISEIIQIWKEELQKARQTEPNKYIEEFLEKTNFAPAIKKWTPHLLEEVKGIAEGSGIDYKTVFAFQLHDEEWWYGLHKRFQIPLPKTQHCSALGVFGQKGIPSLLAQNMDIMTYTDGYEVLFHIKPQDSPVESFIFTFAGLIATNGMNNHSIGICCNTLLQLDHCGDGLPVAYIVRGVLDQEKYEGAVKFIHDIKHASGQNYTIGGPKEVAAFECSSNKVSRFIPYKGATRVYHTNHPLVNDDQSIYKEVLKKLPAERRPKSPGNSEIRLTALEKRLKDPSKRITVDTVKATLSSHDDPKNPVCNHLAKQRARSFSAGCMVMELGKPPVLHLAPGPPCSTEFKAYKF
ncbi:MAG: hypothetical protein JSV96_13135 [Candidatus Aminicenantes bacterium]|nr:MAG: hypothetical protein JSV96_13135 [Candidatus Aminicenantes bacterium]